MVWCWLVHQSSNNFFLKGVHCILFQQSVNNHTEVTHFVSAHSRSVVPIALSASTKIRLQQEHMIALCWLQTWIFLYEWMRNFVCFFKGLAGKRLTCFSFASVFWPSLNLLYGLGVFCYLDVWCTEISRDWTECCKQLCRKIVEYGSKAVGTDGSSPWILNPSTWVVLVTVIS